MQETIGEDPIGSWEQLKGHLKRYIQSAFRTDSPSFEDDREKLLKIPGVLFQEPYLELLPSYVNGKALSSLDGMDLPGLDEAARQGFIALAGAGLMPAGADLYVHQQRMLRAAMQRKHCVVVTGTGSGKTESFLLPVFASIAREALRPSGGWAAAAPPATLPSEWKSAPQWSFGRAAARSEQRKPAVRALLLYPMNALVEDQMSRLRRALDSDDAHAALDLHWGATCHGKRLAWITSHDDICIREGLDSADICVTYICVGEIFPQRLACVSHDVVRKDNVTTSRFHAEIHAATAREQGQYPYFSASSFKCLFHVLSLLYFSSSASVLRVRMGRLDFK